MNPVTVHRTGANLSPMQHVTVHRKSQATPGPVRCQDGGLFLCPFCSATHYKPTEYPRIMAHLASHKWKAIRHEDFVIYSCKLGCDGKAVHFHCCWCPRSYRNRRELLNHLKSHPAPEGHPPPPEGPAPTTEPPPPTEPPPTAGSPLPRLQSEPPMEDQSRAELPPAEPRPPAEPWTATHVTVHRRGAATPGPLGPRAGGLFLCPFCSATHYRPTEYPQIMAHLASHKWKAIQHEDFVIYSCKLGCGGKAVHFHCCRCPRSYRNRRELLNHLKSHPTPEGHPPPPTGPPPPEGPPVQPNVTSEQSSEPPPTLPRPPVPPTPPQPPPEPTTGPSVSHVTVHRKSQATPGPVRCQDGGLFLCPFCSTTHYRPTEYPQIMAHLASHKWKAIQHEDFVIYSCKLGCDGKAVHFHCCWCPRSYRNRRELLNHLKSHPTPPPTGPPPPDRPPLHLAEPPTPPQPRAPPVTEPHPPVEPPTPPQPVAPELRPSRKTGRRSVQCPDCGLSVNSNNMKKHVERKHSALPPRHAITARHHLPSQCVDKTNGVFVVAKSFMGPRVPVHVVRSARVSPPRAGCDMDRCRGRADPGAPGGIGAGPCAHVRSLDYCRSDAEPGEPGEETLGRMAELGRLGPAARDQCPCSSDAP